MGCRPLGQMATLAADEHPGAATSVALAAGGPAIAGGSATPASEPGAWPSDDLERAASHPAGTPDDDAATPDDEAATPDDEAAPSPSSIGSSAWPAALDSAQEAGSPALPASADENGSENIVDEWGRPVEPATEPSVRDGESREVASTTAAPVDPWRGVVFAEDGDDQPLALPAEQPPTRAVFSPTGVTFDRETPEPTGRKLADPETGTQGDASRTQSDPSGTVWPESDQASDSTPSAKTNDSAWPQTDRQSASELEASSDGPTDADLGSDAATVDRLGEAVASPDEVDARKLARASANIVAAGQLAGADETSGIEDDRPPSTTGFGARGPRAGQSPGQRYDRGRSGRA